jgi:hypothetical protein
MHCSHCAQNVAAGQVKIRAYRHRGTSNLCFGGPIKSEIMPGEPRLALFARGSESEESLEGSTMDEADSLVSRRAKAERIDIESPGRIRHKEGIRSFAEAYPSGRVYETQRS